VTVFVTLVAVAITLAGLAHLAAHDPKRRRVFGLEPRAEPRRPALALTAVFLPGVALLALGNGAGFVVWLGATSVAGWGLAAVSPTQAARLRAWLGERAAGARGAWSGARHWLTGGVGTMGRVVALLNRHSRRIAALERRVKALEAELARTRDRVAYTSHGGDTASEAPLGAAPLHGARLARTCLPTAD
jgi:hypothetical protein